MAWDPEGFLGRPGHSSAAWETEAPTGDGMRLPFQRKLQPHSSAPALDASQQGPHHAQLVLLMLWGFVVNHQGVLGWNGEVRG